MALQSLYNGFMVPRRLGFRVGAAKNAAQMSSSAKGFDSRLHREEKCRMQ